MTDAQHAHWLAYLRDLADRLGLKDWDIRLERGEPQNGNALGSNHLQYGQRRCYIYLSSDLFAEKPEDHRWVCVHELLHCHFDPLDDAMDDVADRLADDKATELARAVYKRQREHTLDHIATAIALYLPLPEKMP